MGACREGVVKNGPREMGGDKGEEKSRGGRRKVRAEEIEIV